MNKTFCPRCKEKYRYDASDVGQTIACTCGFSLTLPPAESVPEHLNRSAKIWVGAMALVIVGGLAFAVFMRRDAGNANPPASQSSVVAQAQTGKVNAMTSPVPTSITKPPVAIVATSPATSKAASKSAVEMLQPEPITRAYSLFGFGSSWALAMSDSAEYQLVTHETMKSNVAKYVKEDDLATRELLAKFPTEVGELIDSASIGSKAVGFFPKTQPIKILRDEDGVLALAIPSLAIGTEFNTLRTTERTRSAEVFKDRMEPALKYIRTDASPIGVKKILLGITYGVRDFSEKEWEHTGESLVVVADFDKIKAFVDMKITEDEFCNACKFFLCGGGKYDLKRISVKIE